MFWNEGEKTKASLGKVFWLFVALVLHLFLAIRCSLVRSANYCVWSWVLSVFSYNQFCIYDDLYTFPFLLQLISFHKFKYTIALWTQSHKWYQSNMVFKSNCELNLPLVQQHQASPSVSSIWTAKYNSSNATRPLNFDPDVTVSFFDKWSGNASKLSFAVCFCKGL